jgi:Rrf2 family protein
MLYLSTQEKPGTATRRGIARAMDIPEPFLGKVAQRLSRAGLLEISQGPKGGYRLTRDPKGISLLEVIEAVEGNISLNQCLMRPDSCSRSSMCPVHQIWDRARSQLRSILQDADFAQLAGQEIKKQKTGATAPK